MHLFERAVRVPLIVHAPGRFACRRVAVPVSLVDLLPTLVELGRSPPRASELELQGDGQSLVPLLEGRAGRGRCVLAEYLAEGALAPIFMIRRGAQKFIWSEPDPPLLFDLEQDPDELDNLADQLGARGQVQALTPRDARALGSAGALPGDRGQPKNPRASPPRLSPQGRRRLGNGPPRRTGAATWVAMST